MSQSVAVIGTGLSAVGAIKALRARGIRPTVIDWGARLEADRASMAARMALKQPSEWTGRERDDVAKNPTLNDGSSIPKKLLFGSDYFYGKPRKDAPIKSHGNLPPFSYALGGLSSGWGAAVLPAHPADLTDWPVSAEELKDYSAKVLADLPYSARDDGLSLDFPVLSERNEALQPSRAERWMLNALERAAILKKSGIVFGQARLLVNSSIGASGACRYCGQCMSGCVYGAIYKAGDEILALQEKGLIEYISGALVEKLSEDGNKVHVEYIDAKGGRRMLSFDRVFLAAGAVNSTRIVLNSLGLFGKKARLLSRGGFVIPMLSLRRLPIDWPNCNTQAGIFLELKGKWMGHWVHVQISPENELVRQKLGVGENASGILSRVKRFIASHVVLIFVNYHSDHAGYYDIWLESLENHKGGNRMRTSHCKSLPQWRVMFASWLKLLMVFARIGCFPMFALAKLNSGAYHVGGTLPMSKHLSGKLETDDLGRLSAWNKIHVVDTSIFPSLPGTTVGLLAMANAYRIVDKIKW